MRGKYFGKNRRDTSNFDKEFTKMAVELTPTDKLFIMNLDQNEFQGRNKAEISKRTSCLIWDLKWMLHVTDARVGEQFLKKVTRADPLTLIV
ncbi:hypothetical protein QTP86_011598 [Hemibagrus guttatus]|nr:hypothetical protein QTP86_011598 [Hemibagrus guttatus]